MQNENTKTEKHEYIIRDMAIDYSEDIIKHYVQGPGHFFDSGTLRFHQSIISEVVYPVTDRHGEQFYFVTSEKFSGEPRMYSVRRYTKTDRLIETIGAHGSIPTLNRAKSRARYLAKHGE